MRTLGRVPIQFTMSLRHLRLNSRSCAICLPNVSAPNHPRARQLGCVTAWRDKIDIHWLQACGTLQFVPSDSVKFQRPIEAINNSSPAFIRLWSRCFRPRCRPNCKVEPAELEKRQTRRLADAGGLVDARGLADIGGLTGVGRLANAGGLVDIGGLAGVGRLADAEGLAGFGGLAGAEGLTETEGFMGTAGPSDTSAGLKSVWFGEDY
jgi:hypothetical protein